ncbi:inositol polyphosphate phosphatase [Pyrrhoderma noxium]|uniref:Inositol polyphosphate phosphatase n=1 Tax=Pyrrhoderma noxium TaxID=2282107 RepID=A0A286UWA9_9AGAM|nr:inositol polyphosphate phosphatase [Pyrrhoderma noxium]
MSTTAGTTARSTPEDKLLVQIASYNTNLQGNAGLPQDLVDWMAPTLKVSNFLSRGKQAPDIVAVGFQELLPLHFGLSGLSKQMIESRDNLIRSQIEQHAPNKDRYILVARIVNRVRDVQTQWTGCGPGYMGNKGAVGVRFRLAGQDNEEGGETFTFVNAHLTAHAGNLKSRISDYYHIVGTLLFPPPASRPSGMHTTLLDTSHLFFLGDLNFRLNFPAGDPFVTCRDDLWTALNSDEGRSNLKEYDELLSARKRKEVFVGMHEGEFWRFKCTYKYKLREVDRYNEQRTPAWTDRIMFASYLDPTDNLEKSSINPILYTSIPSYTTSDHKPVVALLLVPTSIFSPSPYSDPDSATFPSADSPLTDPSKPYIPTLTLNLPHHLSRPSSPTSRRPSSPSSTPITPITPNTRFSPSTTYRTPLADPYWVLKRYTGRTLDRIVGAIWMLIVFVGLGNTTMGLVNCLLGVIAWRCFGWLGAGTNGGHHESSHFDV